jgi:hypothetical protein
MATVKIAVLLQYAIQGMSMFKNCLNGFKWNELYAALQQRAEIWELH